MRLSRPRLAGIRSSGNGDGKEAIVAIEVSVIVPAYNADAYIVQAVESALIQTLGDIEVIVVDDASTDGTLVKLREYPDARLRVVVNDVNRGVSHCRNRALALARGKWVAVLDADDWYAPERLEKLLQVASAEQADIVADDLYFVDDGQSVPWGTLISESGQSIDSVSIVDAVAFVEGNTYGKPGLRLGFSKPIFNRDFLMRHAIRYDERMSKHEDYFFYLECLLNGAKFVVVPKPYYFYRTRPGSLTLSAVTGSLELFCGKLKEFLGLQTAAQRNPRLVRALAVSLDQAMRSLQYQRVVEPFKQKRYVDAFLQILKSPRFLAYFLPEIPGILRRRISYYFLGDDSAFTRGHLKGRN